jgi:two-component system chemotaxis response regulator CheB
VIKLLIVDDSALMRRLLTEIFSAAGDFKIEIARSGIEAVDLVQSFAPDVVTLDIQMPGMDGLACLDQIMLLRPCPVVMVSALTAEGANETLDAMALGAVDFIAKPKGAVSLEIDKVAPALVEKVRAAANAKISLTSRLRERIQARAGRSVASPAIAVRKARSQRKTSPAIDRIPCGEIGVVLVGCSTGGPPALDVLLGDLPADFPWPIVIAQHMPATFTGALARRLDKICALAIQEVDKAMPLIPGHAYIGRGDADLLLSRRNGALIAMPAPVSAEHYWHPSVERLVKSGMRLLAPERLIGVLMTGMGTDGATAMTELKTLGGRTIAESAESAVVWGMPGALVANQGASLVCPLDEIAERLLSLVPR